MTQRELNPEARPGNIFISYDRSDRRWAEWVAWELSQVGYQVSLERDSLPGSNYIQELQEKITHADQTVMLLSPMYVRSLEAQPGASPALDEALKGQKGKLVPIRVRECPLEGLLAPITCIDLFNIEEGEIARAHLLDGISRARSQLYTLKPSPYPLTSTQNQEKHLQKSRYPKQSLPPQSGLEPRNLRFIAREALLEKLYFNFHHEKTGMASPQALCGPGGIGKTQIALEYVYRYRESYQMILWMNADSRDHLNQSSIEIARLLYPQQTFSSGSQAYTAIVEWLKANSYWLLVLDHADDWKMIQKILPPTGRGHVLLTTSSQATGARVNPLPVEPLTPEEGALLLLQRSKALPPECTLKDAPSANTQVAQRLSQMLHGLPLAIDQAGAHIEEAGISLEEYEYLFEQSPVTCLKRRGTITLYHALSLAETWWRSFEKIRQADPNVADLLLFCAFLGSHPVPEEIVREGSMFVNTQFHEAVGSQNDWYEMIAGLRKFSFIRRDATAKVLSVHPFLPIILKERLLEWERAQWEERAVRAIHRILTRELLALQPCLVHLHCCILYVRARKMAFPEALALLDIYEQHGT